MIWPARAAAPSAFLPEPAADREEMLAAAIAAPSACDSRNWHLICLCTRESIQGLAGAVAAGVERAVRGLVGDGAYAAACVRRNSFSQGAPMAAAA